MNKNELILLKQTEVIINKYYKEYIKFMDISFDMPVLQINFKQATKDVFANTKEVNGKIILTVDPLLGKTPFIKTTLYHEFTHIYDHAVMEQFGIYQPYIYHVFTEYHASQIQMMADLNLITPFGIYNKKIDHKSVFEKLLNEKEDFQKRVSLLNLTITNDFSKAIDWFCYYIGKVNIFVYYFNEYNVSLLDLTEFVNTFGDEIVSLQKTLFQADTRNISVEDIVNIADQHLVLVKKFNPRFPIHRP